MTFAMESKQTKQYIELIGSKEGNANRTYVSILHDAGRLIEEETLLQVNTNFIEFNLAI